jgi:hypothetical protein
MTPQNFPKPPSGARPATTSAPFDSLKAADHAGTVAKPVASPIPVDRTMIFEQAMPKVVARNTPIFEVDVG